MKDPPQPPRRVKICAELGVNHQGDLATALRMVEFAHDAGAGAVKVQAFTARRLCGPKWKWHGATRRTLRALELDADELLRIRAEAHKRGLEFICTPFDLEWLDWAEGHADRIKLGSGELRYRPLVNALADSTKPRIVSTGMTTTPLLYGLRDLLGCNTLWLHCTSAYPCPAEAVHMAALDTKRSLMGGVWGYSDHTRGTTAATMAVALDCVWLERHITPSHDLRGPDHTASDDPAEFGRYVAAVREAEQMIGSTALEIRPEEQGAYRASDRDPRTGLRA